MKSRRKSAAPKAFISLKDLVPRNDPKGGSAQKTVFGERPPVFDTNEKQPSQDIPAERRQKPGHGRNRTEGKTT